MHGLEAAFLDGVAEASEGPVTLGRDGVTISLPSRSEPIERSDRL